MGTLLDLPWPDCVVPRAQAPGLWGRIKTALGLVPQTSQFTGCVPWMAELNRLAPFLPLRSLEPEVADLGTLAAAHANTCRHCYGGTRAAMLLLGYTHKQVQALTDRLYGGETSPRVQAAAEVIRRVVALDAKEDDFAAAKTAGFAEEQIAELATVAAFVTIHARINTPLAIPPEKVEVTQRGFFAPILGLLLRLGASRKRAAWRALESRPLDVKGPFAKLLTPLLPSPAAGELRALVDACVASDICPRRARLLAMAVVARAANDGVLQAVFQSLLHADGVPSKIIDAAVLHLDAPELYDFERVLLQFARSSVSYRPGEIQERARMLAEGRAPALVVDAIGAVAMANGLARLSVLRAR